MTLLLLGDDERVAVPVPATVKEEGATLRASVWPELLTFIVTLRLWPSEIFDLSTLILAARIAGVLTVQESAVSAAVSPADAAELLSVAVIVASMLTLPAVADEDVATVKENVPVVLASMLVGLPPEAVTVYSLVRSLDP